MERNFVNTATWSETVARRSRQLSLSLLTEHAKHCFRFQRSTRSQKWLHLSLKYEATEPTRAAKRADITFHQVCSGDQYMSRIMTSVGAECQQSFAMGILKRWSSGTATSVSMYGNVHHRRGVRLQLSMGHDPCVRKRISMFGTRQPAATRRLHAHHCLALNTLVFCPLSYRGAPPGRLNQDGTA